MTAPCNALAGRLTPLRSDMRQHGTPPAIAYGSAVNEAAVNEAAVNETCTLDSPD
jgi:hypothetical protein